MRRTLIGALLALSAGCGPRVTYGAPEPLPLVSTSVDPDRWYVWLDGGPALGPTLWFFDSGYSSTTCDDQLAARLELPKGAPVRVRGEASSIQARRSPLPPLFLGGHAVRGARCVVRDLNTTSSIRDPAEVPVAGVLGADLLLPFLVTIDPAGPSLTLAKPPRDPLFSRDDPHAVRLGTDRWLGGRPEVRFRVDGRRAKAVIDTGASGTYLDVARPGLEPSATAEGVAVRGTGQGGQVTRDLAWYEVELDLAGHHLPITVIQREGASGLLGLNAVGGLEQTWDFKHRRARFVAVTPAPVPSWRKHRFGSAKSTPEGASDAPVSPR